MHFLKLIPQMSAFAVLVKVGPKSPIRLQTWYQNTPPFDAQYLLIVRLGSNYKIQVKFQPLVRTLPREGEFQPGTWAWVLSVKFPTEQRCPTDVSRNCVVFQSQTQILPAYTPGGTGFSFDLAGML